MRKSKSSYKALFVLCLALALGDVYSQGLPGPINKRARTLEDYEPSTLKKIIAIDIAVENLPRERRAGAYSDLMPFTVSAIYTGLSRPISRKSKDALFHWAQCCAGNPDQFTGPYDTEMRFDENGAQYWLAVQKRSLPDFRKELKEGQTVKLYLIRVSARQPEGNPGSALLVETLKR